MVQRVDFNALTNTKDYESLTQNEPTFLKKSSLPFKGVIQNGSYKKGQNFITTYANDIEYEINDSSITLKYLDQTKTLTPGLLFKSKTVSKPKVQGTIKSLTVNGYVVEDGGIYYWYSHDGTLNKQSANPLILKTSKYGDECIESKVTQTSLSFTLYYYTADTSVKVNPNTNEPYYVLAEEDYNIDVSFPWEPKQITNWCYDSNDNLVVGADYSDSRYSYVAVIDSNKSIISSTLFSGLLYTDSNNDTYVTGQPMVYRDGLYPINEDLASYIDIMDNGQIRVDMASTTTTVSTEMTDNVNNLSDNSLTEFSSSANTSYSTTYHNRTNWYPTSVLKIVDGIITPYTSKPAVESNGGTIVSQGWTYDIDSSFGNYWSSETTTDYEQVFPRRYEWFNSQSLRGEKWDYGYGWSKNTVLGWAVVKYSSETVILTTPTYIEDVSLDKTDTTISETYSEMLDSQSGRQVKRLLLDSLGSALETKSHDGYFPYDYTQASTTYKANSQYWCKYNNTYWKNHLIESTYRTSRTWPAFLRTFDLSTDSLPEYRNLDGLQCLYYNNILVGLGLNDTLLNSPSTEIVYFGYNDNKIVYSSENNQIVIIELTEDLSNFKIYKVADFIYATNALTYYNTFVESKDGSSIFMTNGFKCYNMGTEFRGDLLGSLSLLSPLDGSSYNDVYQYGSGINVNLDDKVPTASWLLPALTISMYLSATQTTYFNNTVISGTRWLFEPIYNLIDSNDVVDIFFTHSQLTTDITYKGSYNGDKESSYDRDKNETSWWIESAYYPLGISDIPYLLGVNYLSSTIKLVDDYSVALYTSNNSVFTVYDSQTEVYFGSQIFTIMTSSYSFNGEAIYYLGTGATTENEFVCYASSMVFLGNTGTEGYFYSKADKMIYAFTGSNTLVPKISVAILGDYIDSAFNSSEQVFYILFENALLFYSQETSAILYDDYSSYDKLYTTSYGVVLVGDIYYHITRFNEDYELMPFDVETNFIGDNTGIQKLSVIDLTFVPQDTDKTITITVKSNSNGKTIEDKRDVVVKANNKRVRVTPSSVNGQAFSIGIHSDDFIMLNDIIYNMNRVSDNTSVV